MKRTPQSTDIPENAPALRLFRRALILALLLTLAALAFEKHREAQQQAADLIWCPVDGGCPA